MRKLAFSRGGRGGAVQDAFVHLGLALDRAVAGALVRLAAVVRDARIERRRRVTAAALRGLSAARLRDIGVAPGDIGKAAQMAAIGSVLGYGRRNPKP